MFGLDQLFDFDKNGKLDAFERASEMAFLSSAEEESRKPGRKSGRSSGRLYDRIGKKAKGTVKVVLPDAVICRLDK